MLQDTNVTAATPSSSDPFTSSENGALNRRKRKPAGTPDPDAEVVSLSPKTLLESDRYVCEICNQGFQRDQNLQMHRRRHKVPWKLLKRETQEVKKRVFVCPEPSCLHHDPCHALGDLVGIKKHFRRKHSNYKQWVCEKCNKGYAVQSDYKAHLKTCGTRGHSCDCGRVFSRVESFIEHQDACTIRRVQPELHGLQPACSSRTASSTSPSSDANFSIAPPLPGLTMQKPEEPVFLFSTARNNPSTSQQQEHNLDLQLQPSISNTNNATRHSCENHATHLKLSIGSSSDIGDGGENNTVAINNLNLEKNKGSNDPATLEAKRLKEFAHKQLKLAMAEKALAEEARQQAKRQTEIAEIEFANAKRIRQQAQSELEKAQVLKDQATKKISATIMQITCQACKQQFQASTSVAPPCDETSLAMSYMSSATTEGE
ncbi:zinc finger protein SHOOT GRAVITROPISM 5-like [Mangifera indica]|uniref:zinc finger protein SHOOT GRAVITROPISM 5-like n=1 Tax=Mangifera indica TaxID=29780 RepID=UPI001CFA549E|nr:zinc finger protein SHOOT GRAVITROPISM 5-like [Mangifera indica]XP_044492195.1 zinc finger protein SHOOT GRAVITROPISM 5-like [Mangifera indica]